MEPTTEDDLTPQRATKISVLSQHLSRMLIGVTHADCACPEHQPGGDDDATIGWLDAVYAVGLAVRALSLVTQARAEKEGVTLADAEVIASAREMLTKALEDHRLGVMKFSSRAELEAFAAQTKHGGH